ncbi:phage tail protein [Agarivorans aestuarii]|uniref:phage tail protein n=1 Tax=Agarivorans aestuarii TaxID=1563703 RepID=UPI001C806585|nr:tail fiber protein [Agarivorans aestuarii]
MEAYIGQVIIFAGNYAPRDWEFCHGQILAISSNQALFAIIGTIYGGDGRTSFALPDLRGRTPISAGQGQSLPQYPLGQHGGAESHILNESQMPSHNHQVTVKAKCLNGPGNAQTPVGAIWANDASASSISYSNSAANADMGASAIEISQQNKGSNLAVNNMQPYLALNYIICVNGLFPSRS